MELTEMGRHWEGKTYEFYTRHGAYQQRKEAQALANLDAAELRRQGFLARVTFEGQDYGIWAVCWKGPKVREAVRVEVVPDPLAPSRARLAKITRNGLVVAAPYVGEPFPTQERVLEDYKADPRMFHPYDESTGTFIQKKKPERSMRDMLWGAGHKKKRPRLSR